MRAPEAGMDAGNGCGHWTLHGWDDTVAEVGEDEEHQHEHGTRQGHKNGHQR